MAAKRRRGQRFSDHYEVGLDQWELDFVDIPLDCDVHLFLDPYTFKTSDDEWFAEANNMVVDYFDQVLAGMRGKTSSKAERLLEHLHEPHETHLGLSTTAQGGRGIGSNQAKDIFTALKRSKAVKTGFLEDLADCELVIPGIGRDKVSDITTNIIRLLLLEYTHAQCASLSLPTRPVAQHYWHAPSAQWRNGMFPLPVIETKRGPEALILVPKFATRTDIAFSSQRYYRHFVLDYLQSEYDHPGSALVQVLKNGRRVVYKKDVESRHPYSKDYLLDFSEGHPDVLGQYRRSVDSRPRLDDRSIEEAQPRPRSRRSVSYADQLAAIQPGRPQQGEFHKIILAILQATFSPSLTGFRPEQPINEQRKFVDIYARNVAESGFFLRLNTFHHIKCPRVFIECKNYTDDPKNPEFDQLAGRLTPRKGQFGILVCRNLHNRERAHKRCRDYLQENKYILAFDDSDIVEIIDLHSSQGAVAVSEFLDDRFDTLVL